MNRRFISLLAILLCIVTILPACTEENNEDTTVSEIITEAPLENLTDNSSKTEATTAPAETTTEEEPVTEKQYIGTVKGYTSKGFVISEKDGKTYIDNILVANKTYSLPESYNPGALLSECEAAFKAMQSAAAVLGYDLWNASGFRSYELQASLYKRYSDRDGKEAADRYSARPGHSEHQTGLAIDLNEISSSFANTKEGKWVEENCHKYGFILRYPKGKEAQTGYMYEPWHIRYVGVDAATAIYNSGLCFEEYYGITSAYAPEAVIEEATTLPEETTSEEVTVEETTEASEITTAAAVEENTAEAINAE